ncbi:transposase [Xanthomonas campestris]|uniref:transposase n=1 Tax=Xanthomonas campestris TaxID=339 RepID=UPI001CDCDA10|nr:transposase [Xanthomonas campestris]MCC5048542.1 transposase [Xanthomonas campestris]MCC5051347.1 transposase [Xanthomonas campestris pv. aberrans]MCC5055311.1 transposase [Xanthomonas campestris]MCC5060590.1 transposase [Xanthomonas campestris]MCC5077267.1 transposase [Xanthomonas campestris pv. campestris]
MAPVPGPRWAERLRSAHRVDKFHIMRHLSDASDQIRRDEYKRLQGMERGYIKASATPSRRAGRT